MASFSSLPFVADTSVGLFMEDMSDTICNVLSLEWMRMHRSNMSFNLKEHDYEAPTSTPTDPGMWAT